MKKIQVISVMPCDKCNGKDCKNCKRVIKEKKEFIIN